MSIDIDLIVGLIIDCFIPLQSFYFSLFIINLGNLHIILIAIIMWKICLYIFIKNIKFLI